MKFRTQALTFIAGFGLLLNQGCSPSTPLASKKSTEDLEKEASTQVVNDPAPVTPAVEEKPPPVVDPNAPPDWKARYQALNAEYKAAFVQPPIGKTVRLPMKTGQIHEGKIAEVNERGVKLQVSAGEIELQRKSIALKARVRLFAEDFAHEKALRVVKMEKHKYDLEQQKQQQAEADAKKEAAAKARALEARKTHGQLVPPVNDPNDGSVPAVKAYIEKNTRNSGSIKYLKWGKVIPKDGKYIVRCRYQADGGDLGQLILDKYFFLNEKGRVYQAANYKGP